MSGVNGLLAVEAVELAAQEEIERVPPEIISIVVQGLWKYQFATLILALVLLHVVPVMETKVLIVATVGFYSL